MSPVRVLWFVGSAVVVGVCVTAVVFTQLVEPAPRVPAAPAVPVVDVSDLPAFWEQQYSTASWYPATKVPLWDGNVLTAETSLASEQPAKAICVALSMYWLQSKDGRFRSVRVVDSAGQVLVSRHTESDQCTWRR